MTELASTTRDIDIICGRLQDWTWRRSQQPIWKRLTSGAVVRWFLRRAASLWSPWIGVKEKNRTSSIYHYFTLTNQWCWKNSVPKWFILFIIVWGWGLCIYSIYSLDCIAFGISIFYLLTTHYYYFDFISIYFKNR